MKQCVFTPAAVYDLDGIWNYTFDEWGPAQVERYLRMIQDTVVGLGKGTQRSLSVEDIRAGYRKALVGMHVLFFKDAADTIEIVRILHQQTDLSAHLGEANSSPSPNENARREPVNNSAIRRAKTSPNY
ncbi:type II toxin-antitoxin system RelE/ParE family toxin [Caballeronia sp. INDeC2]|uniref:type II toxin-antitoxin system RelE/ParE family toxin n=1 Tax=Caballeronia sp. INDeC2 TaxID=2921747 RepID=UPI00202986D6